MQPSSPVGAATRRRKPSPVWWLIAGMAISTAVLYFAWIPRFPRLPAPTTVPWWAIAIGFALTETFVVHIRVRREAETFSLSELPLILGLFFVAPTLLVPAHVRGAGVVLGFRRRQKPVKLLFNLTMMALQSALAITFFRAALVFGSPLGPAGWIGAFLAAVLTGFMTDIAITAAISLTEGRLRLRPMFPLFGAAVSVANTSLALTAAMILWERPEAAWTVLILTGVIFAAYRGYTSLRAEHDRIEVLYEAARTAQGSLDLEETTAGLMQSVREMFHAEMAEVTAFSAFGKDAVTTVMGRDGSVTRSGPVDLDPTEGVWARVVSEEHAVLLSKPIPAERLRRHFERRGIREAMVAPLKGRHEVFGTVLVGNPLTMARDFTEPDLRLFETVVNHAGISLENGRLVDRLRTAAAELEFQAFHDALTRLGNRNRFQDEIEAALRSAREGGPGCAVLLMDVDRFKEINDTLGHPNGDVLLRQIAERLEAVSEEGELVARLGGDEFGILVSETRGPADAAAAAERALAALSQPFTIDGLDLKISASVGVALAPEHGMDPAALIQRADVAMYNAKARHGRFEFYEAQKDEYSPARLALLGELGPAIDQGELFVMYQPKARLPGGQVVGVEALVRWMHPTQGLILPDRFIPYAEQTGLIDALTDHVVRGVVAQVRRWRDRGLEVPVAVNLSAKNLLDPGLPDRVAALLDEQGVPRHLLEFELTETSIMADLDRSQNALERLQAMGIEIAIDDFGTGYSSLSQLRHLPIGTIKIDKSFVLGMSTDVDDVAIVRTTIELGRSLGLKVVAEGVETEEVWERLVNLGCEMAQGYLLSRPMPAEAVAEWMRNHEAGWTNDRSSLGR